MNERTTLILLIYLLLEIVSAQTDSLSGKYLSIGSKKVGVCFGNSPIYTGLRFNLTDNQVRQVNTINFSILKSHVYQSNGISLSLFINQDNYNNGLSFAFVFNYGQSRNGLAVGGLFLNAKKINGVGFAGLSVSGDTLNGLFMGLYGVTSWSPDWKIKLINGCAMGLVGTGAEKVNGLTIGAINGSNELHGLSIGIFNRTEKLRGIQFGLINYAGNNPKGLKWLPLINIHLR